MLSVASVGSASGSANYFAKDNYYSNEESAEASMWFGAGAEMLGLAPGEEGEISTETISEGSEQAVDGEERLADDPQVEGEAGDDAVSAPTDPEQDDELAAKGAPRNEGQRDDHTGFAPEAGATAPLEGLKEGDALFTSEGAEARAEPQPGGKEGGGAEDRPSIATDIGVDLDLASLPELGSSSSDTGPAPDAAHQSTGSMPLSNPSGRVDTTTFENILNGKLPDGTQVGEPGKRALGMDLTFSAPKSVSILGLVGGDKRLIEANMKAVQTTMRFAEKHFAEGRVKESGSAVPVRTGNLVYALFAHDTSRSLDPQAHVHAVIANVTRMPNGEWRSLHNGQLWKNNTVLGSVYNAALRENVEKLGYKVELAGKHGSFEITGVPKDVRDAFSQRREHILERAAELGISSHAGMDMVAKASRDPKINAPEQSALKADWKERAQGIGFDPQKLIEESKIRSAGPTSLIDHARHIAVSVQTGIERAGAFLSTNQDPLLSRKSVELGLTVEARTELAVAGGVRHLEQREAAFGVHQLTKAALDRGLSGVTPEGISSRVSALIRQELLVPGATDRPGKEVTMLASAHSMATERSILAAIEQGKGQVEPLLPADFAGEALRGAAGDRDLNAGQLAAATSIISSPDRIIAVQGIAGAGKSTMLGTTADVLRNYGKDVLGLAFQNKMVGDLAEGAGIKTQTLASFLLPYERMIAENDRSGLNAARKEMQGSVVIVEEASMVSNKQMASLTDVANRLELDKLVLVGDRQQLLSIDAGKSFALSQAGGAATSRMDVNLRQRTDEMRIVATLANRGQASEALSVLGKNVISTRDRVGEASARWLALPVAERERTMVLTSGREARGDINTAIQSGLIAEGSLKGQGRTLTVVEHVDRTREDLREARHYEPGLSLSLWGDEKSLGLKRGEYRILQRINGGKVLVEGSKKRVTFDPKKLSPARREDRMTMTATKEIKVHEGDKIRWTGNDKDRGIHNSSIGRILSMDAKGVTIENADKSVVRLAPGDPMLRRLDLAYTLNMHMAQGVTTDKAMIVMGSEERFLSNQRLFNVGVTRARDGVTIITDNQGKLARQLDRTPGDKLSALEVTGKLDIDRSPVSIQNKPLDLGPIPKEALSQGLQDPSLRPPAPSSQSTPTDKQPAKPDVDLPALQFPEKVKALEL